MSIIMDEYEWAEKMIENRDLGKMPFKTLDCVARYYRANQYSKREIRKMLEAFLLQCDPTASIVSWDDRLDKISRHVDKRRLIQVDGVDVTTSEIRKIQELKSKRQQRLAFTLLCVSKYWNAVSKANNYWVNTDDKDIMAMANIKCTVKLQCELYNGLFCAGLIKFSKKVGNLNMQVLFAEQGELAIRVTDFRNLGYRYERFCGDTSHEYVECENCGLLMRRRANSKGRPRKYCDDCSLSVVVKNKVNHAMREGAC